MTLAARWPRLILMARLGAPDFPVTHESPTAQSVEAMKGQPTE